MSNSKSNKRMLQNYESLILEEDNINGYIQHLNGIGLSPNTVRYYKAAARSYANFLDGKGNLNKLFMTAQG